MRTVYQFRYVPYSVCSVYSVVINVFANQNPYRTTLFHTNYSVCQLIVKDVILTTEYTEHTENVWMDGRVLRVVHFM